MQSVLKTHSTTGTSRNIQKHLCCVSKSGWVIPASVISSWPLKPGIDEVRRPTVTAWPSTLHEDSVLILCGINWAHPYAVWIWSVEVSIPMLCESGPWRSRQVNTGPRGRRCAVQMVRGHGVEPLQAKPGNEVGALSIPRWLCSEGSNTCILLGLQQHNTGLKWPQPLPYKDHINQSYRLGRWDQNAWTFIGILWVGMIVYNWSMELDLFHNSQTN